MKTHYLVTKAGIHLFIELLFVLSLSRFPFIDQVKQLILFLELSFDSLQIINSKVHDEYFMALSDTYGSRIMSFLSFSFLWQGPIVKCTLTWGNGWTKGRGGIWTTLSVCPRDKQGVTIRC